MYRVPFFSLAILLLSACGGRGPDVSPPSGRADPPSGVYEEGIASWYGEPFNGRPTASGEIYDMHDLTAAHRTLPLATCVAVRRIDDGRSVTVRVNDRGPFVDDQHRIIDLSYAAARVLGLVLPGTAEVEVRAVDDGSGC